MGQTTKIFEGLPCRTLIGWFLILWAATFFFQAIWGFLDVGGSYYSAGESVIEILWDLADLAIADVLAILGLKVLRGECFRSLMEAAWCPWQNSLLPSFFR